MPGHGGDRLRGHRTDGQRVLELACDDQEHEQHEESDTERDPRSQLEVPGGGKRKETLILGAA